MKVCHWCLFFGYAVVIRHSLSNCMDANIEQCNNEGLLLICTGVQCYEQNTQMGSVENALCRVKRWATELTNHVTKPNTA